MQPCDEQNLNMLPSSIPRLRCHDLLLNEYLNDPQTLGALRVEIVDVSSPIVLTAVASWPLSTAMVQGTES